MREAELGDHVLHRDMRPSRFGVVLSGPLRGQECQRRLAESTPATISPPSAVATWVTSQADHRTRRTPTFVNVATCEKELPATGTTNSRVMRSPLRRSWSLVMEMSAPSGPSLVCSA